MALQVYNHKCNIDISRNTCATTWQIATGKKKQIAGHYWLRTGQSQFVWNKSILEKRREEPSLFVINRGCLPTAFMAEEISMATVLDLLQTNFLLLFRFPWAIIQRFCSFCHISSIRVTSRFIKICALYACHRKHRKIHKNAKYTWTMQWYFHKDLSCRLHAWQSKGHPRPVMRVMKLLHARQALYPATC